MKALIKNIFIIVLILDLSIILIYASSDILSDNIIIENNIQKNTSFITRLPLKYKEHIPDRFFLDVTNKPVFLGKNNTFKLIMIQTVVNPNLFSIDNLLLLIELKKKKLKRKIDFIYITTTVIPETKIVELSNLQNLFNIKICSLKDSELYKMFNLREKRCEFYLILSDNNEVRYANYIGGVKLLHDILLLEFKRN